MPSMASIIPTVLICFAVSSKGKHVVLVKSPMYLYNAVMEMRMEINRQILRI